MSDKYFYGFKENAEKEENDNFPHKSVILEKRGFWPLESKEGKKDRALDFSINAKYNFPCML